MTSIRTGALVVAAVLVALVAPASADVLSAQSPGQAESSAGEDLNDETSVATPQQALKQDAGQLAKIEGIGQADAEAALIASDELRPVAGKLRGLVGDREVSMTKVYVPVTKIVVEISGEERIPGLDQIVADSPHPVEVSYVDKPSVEQLHKALTSATALWEKAYPEVTGTTVDDRDPGHVLVYVKPGAALDEAHLRELDPSFPKTVRLTVADDAGATFRLNSRG